MAKPTSTTPDRGRDAERPRDIPRRGWRAIAKRVWNQLGADRVSLLAAGVAFYAMLALVPALIAAVAVYGLFADPASLQQQIESLSASLPSGVDELLRDQLGEIVNQSGGGLSLALGLSVAGALWSASSGMGGLMQAVNAAYDEGESRSAIRLRLLALGGTLVAIFGFLIAFALIAVLPAVLGSMGLGDVGATVASIVRWPLLAGIGIVGLGLIYRYAPDRDPAKWRWVSWGAVIATALWLLASAGFSWYVSNFGSYNKTYGSLGAVIVLLLWLWISAYVTLLGAEINAEMEHQTARDTTRGKAEPVGRRGAYVADDVPQPERG